jgi:hypothetical protein
MNPEVKAKWVAALRSGRYQQGRQALRRGHTFCCLGVLCDISGLGEWSDNWYCPAGDSHGSLYHLPNPVIEWAGVESDSPIVDLADSAEYLTELNDAGKTFEEIADLIEKHL